MCQFTCKDNSVDWLVHLIFNISNTDISNTMDTWKWFVNPNHLFFIYFTFDISNTRIFQVFKQSHLAWENGVWLCITCSFSPVSIFHSFVWIFRYLLAGLFEVSLLCSVHKLNYNLDDSRVFPLCQIKRSNI